MEKENSKKFSKKVKELEEDVLASIVKFLIRNVVFKLFIYIKVYNVDVLKNRSVVLCPNHLGEIDKFYFWAHFNNNCSIAKKEFFKTETIPQIIRAEAFKFFDAIPVDRDKVSTSTFHGVEKFFEKKKEQGKNPICITYPQGTISDFLAHQNEDTIKKGPFFLADRLNVPIVPVYMEQLRFFKKSIIVYGEPIHINLKDFSDKKDICEDPIYASMKDENSKNNRMKQLCYLYYCKLWLEEVNRLHKEAERLAGRPMRKPYFRKKKYIDYDAAAAKRKQLKLIKQDQFNSNLNQQEVK